MKVVALVAMFILCQILPGLSNRRKIPCYGEVFYDCKDFCRRNCIETRNVCLSECNHGCGCREALIISNNGGCLPIQICNK